eukprot:NODE_8577_length_1485_cov_4.187776.p1 GENE.NODE_8577_length_1485_cov_4.187776~~NODE_8577_length_1485_cov_4.187776.p1  ORF type:complete len:405 (+),score=56.57 NODE_8577_length_1485_cov_4.187776:65-1279(+)
MSHKVWSTTTRLLALEVFIGSLAIVGSAWLFWKLGHLHPRYYARLFPKQLRALACADLFFSLTLFGTILPPYMPRAYQSFTCTVAHLLFGPCRLVSTLIESHIAFSFLLQSLHCSNRAKCLDHSLWPLVFLGFVSGLLEAKDDGWVYVDHLEDCLPRKRCHLSMAVLVACFVVSMLAYVSAICVSCKAPFAVQRANFRRAAVYPLNFMLCYILVLYLYCATFAGKYYGEHMYESCRAFELSRGLLNAGAYALQSRYVRHSRYLYARSSGEIYHPGTGQTRTLDSDHSSPNLGTRISGTWGDEDPSMSFRVAFGGVDICEVSCCSSVRTQSSQLSREAIHHAEAEEEEELPPRRITAEEQWVRRDMRRTVIMQIRIERFHRAALTFAISSFVIFVVAVILMYRLS